jgi:hypothetical protein
MPFYGQVWRQRTVPVLWVSDVHDESLLVSRDLRQNSTPPIRRTNSDTNVDLLLPDRAPEIEPPIYDSDELEDDDSDEEGGASRPEGDQGGFDDFGYDDYNDMTEESSEMAQLEDVGWEKLMKLRNLRDELLPLLQALEEQAGHISISVMPDAIPQNHSDLMHWAREYHEKQWEREEKQAEALLYFKRLHHLMQAIDHALEYEPTHRHIHEIPDPITANHSTMLNWADNWFSIQVQRAVKDTWSPERRGNMFL